MGSSSLWFSSPSSFSPQASCTHAAPIRASTRSLAAAASSARAGIAAARAAAVGSPLVASAGIKRIGVVGLGAMGAGIAQLAIEAGYETVGREVTAELGDSARGRIAHFLQRKVDKERMTAAERESALDALSLTTELGAFADCDLVVEAIVEDLAPKR